MDQWGFIDIFIVGRGAKSAIWIEDFSIWTEECFTHYKILDIKNRVQNLVSKFEILLISVQSCRKTKIESSYIQKIIIINKELKILILHNVTPIKTSNLLKQ